MCGSDPLLLGENFCHCTYAPVRELPTQGYAAAAAEPLQPQVLSRAELQPSYPASCASFFISLVADLFFQSDFSSSIVVVCCFQSLSCVGLCDLITVAHQAHLSMEFSRQEYWNGLPFPSPGEVPNPGIEPGSPALQADSLLAEPPGKCQNL